MLNVDTLCAASPKKGRTHNTEGVTLNKDESTADYVKLYLRSAARVTHSKDSSVVFELR